MGCNMLGLFKSEPKQTHYNLEKARQDKLRLEQSKLRLAVCAQLLRQGESKHNVDLALEMHDLIVYIEQHTQSGDFKLGVMLSDCDTLREVNKLGYNKYTIESTNNEVWK